MRVRVDTATGAVLVTVVPGVPGWVRVLIELLLQVIHPGISFVDHEVTGLLQVSKIIAVIGDLGTV